MTNTEIEDARITIDRMIVIHTEAKAIMTMGADFAVVEVGALGVVAAASVASVKFAVLTTVAGNYDETAVPVQTEDRGVAEVAVAVLLVAALEDPE